MLKPDWSPRFQAATRYLGAAVAVKAGFAKRAMAGARAGELVEMGPTTRAEHVRRVLLTRSLDADSPMAPPSPAPRLEARDRACIIIPTRDRRDLLERCVASLGVVDAGAPFEIIVVDNGSAEPGALAFLDALERAPARRVLRAAGAFNFSRLCNLAVRETEAPFLAFLNNDVEAIEPGWLARMLELAARPEVGAVGAKLLYPDRTIQHAGVVLGTDGKAAHVQRALGAAAPGYLGSLLAPREVGAVTAACLVVEASKFNAVEGFDEVHLPIESNDIDLCLRLAERGWSCVLEPRSVLLHHESASRGTNRLQDARYAEQTAYFRQRWAGALRDDPYFHPGLSLDVLRVALG